MDQVNISIIVPVYNGEETLKKCLRSVTDIDYPKDHFEILLINDGSNDKTLEIADKFSNIHITTLGENKGRLIARKTGAEKAKYDELFFVDSRIEVAQNILLKRNDIDYSPLIAGDLGEVKYSSNYDTLFYLIRKKIYHPYYPQRNYGRELWINKQNFLKAPKGTGCIFINKELFLKSLPGSMTKDTSDDTKILKNIVFEKSIKLLRHTDVKVIYHQRITTDIYSWIHHRGRIWADHYLSFINIYSIFYTIFSVMLVLILVSNMKLLFVFFILIFVLTGIFLAENIKDFIILVKTLPLLAIRFYAGTIEKLMKKYLSGKNK